MREASVAKRYAHALIGAAQESGKLTEFHGELERVVQAVRDNRDLKAALESPVLPPSQKKALFDGIQEKLKLVPAVANLVRILIDQERVDILPMIGLLFRDMADEALGQVRVQVKAAAALGDEAKALQKILEKALGKKVILQVTVVPELLGGLFVRVKDYVFDGSLKRELERIKASVVEKAVA
jgi:F-type H+-transporting ATPase subunit delta